MFLQVILRREVIQPEIAWKYAGSCIGTMVAPLENRTQQKSVSALRTLGQGGAKCYAGP
jgi:hypothetical protein